MSGFLNGLKKRYRIEGLSEFCIMFGINPGRRRYRVECLECGEVLHEATTGTRSLTTAHDKVPCEPQRTRQGGP